MPLEFEVSVVAAPFVGGTDPALGQFEERQLLTTALGAFFYSENERCRIALTLFGEVWKGGYIAVFHCVNSRGRNRNAGSFQF